MLYQIIPGTYFDQLFEEITANATLNNDNILTESMKLRTGYKLRATFTTKVLEYKISVKRDVLGTGELNIENAKEIG